VVLLAIDIDQGVCLIHLDLLHLFIYQLAKGNRPIHVWAIVEGQTKHSQLVIKIIGKAFNAALQ
jgi:hypothetical protein